MRDILINAYLDYFNNYLTVELYAEHNGLTVGEAMELFQLARKLLRHGHPEY